MNSNPIKIVDKDKRRLIDIVDSIEAKLNKIIGDNNMGNLKYARDSVSEIPTFFSKRDKIKVAVDEIKIDPKDWIVVVWSMANDVYCATRLYSPSTNRIKVWDGYAAKYKDGIL